MATKQQWREYFKLINDREPSLEEFQAAIEKGEIEDLPAATSPASPVLSEMKQAPAVPNPAASQSPQTYTQTNPFPRQNTAVSTSDHSVSLFESYKLFWKNYVNFTGRSRRSEFWWTYLINGIIGFVIFVVPLIFVVIAALSSFGSFHGYGRYYDSFPAGNMIVGPIMAALLAFTPAILFGLAILVPALAIFFRRLRDTGLGTMNAVALIVFHVCLYILGYIPFFGFLFRLASFALSIYQIVLLAQKTDHYQNRPEPITDWFARLFKN